MNINSSIVTSKPGRPTAMTDGVVAQLCTALTMGASIQGACNWANIDKATFYRHRNSDPIFATKIASSIMMLYVSANELVFNEIFSKKNPKVAMWWLERTDPERFGRKRLCRQCHKLQAQYHPRNFYRPTPETD